MKLSKIIKKGIMMVLFVFLSLNFPNTHVNVQASVEAKEVIEQQLFGKDGKTSIDVSQYQLNKTETKQIVTELQKDYGTIGLMECTYQTLIVSGIHDMHVRLRPESHPHRFRLV